MIVSSSYTLVMPSLLYFCKLPVKFDDPPLHETVAGD